MSGRGDIIPDIYRRLVHPHSYVIANSRVGGFRVVPFDKLSIHSVQVNPSLAFQLLVVLGNQSYPQWYSIRHKYR
jgi:hypothetical protein